MAVYGITTNSDTEVSQLLAREGAYMEEVFLKADCGDMARGTVLAMNASTYFWEQLNPAGADGSEIARGILVEPITDSAAAQKALVYTSGHFRFADLIWPDGATDAQIQGGLTDLRQNNCISDRSELTFSSTVIP